MQLIYRVASTLGIMVCEVMERMPIDELVSWHAWFELEYEAAKKAEKELNKESRRR